MASQLSVRVIYLICVLVAAENREILFDRGANCASSGDYLNVRETVSRGSFVCVFFSLCDKCNKLQESFYQMKLAPSKKTRGVITGCAYRRMCATVHRQKKKKETLL